MKHSPFEDIVINDKGVLIYFKIKRNFKRLHRRLCKMNGIPPPELEIIKSIIWKEMAYPSSDLNPSHKQSKKFLKKRKIQPSAK